MLAPALRKDRDEPTSLLHALGTLHANGVGVDWTAVLPAGRHVDLPTYAFQRQRFWPQAVAHVGDVASAGLVPAGHPLIAATVSIAGGDGALLTGRLSTATHPWLADHVVAGRVLLPGTAFVELVLRAAEQVGAARIEDLTIEAPLVLPDNGAVQVQVSVGGADERGDRPVAVYSRPHDGDWLRHASGAVSERITAATTDHTEWPVSGAEPIDLDGFYDGHIAGAGLVYGPAFRGLHRAWRVGEDILAEVALPEADSAGAAAFGLHPALLDAALHAVSLGSFVTDAGPVRLPFAWTGVTLHATGASVLRARLTPTGPDAVTLHVADGAGAPVATIESLALRPIAAGQIDAAAGAARLQDALFSVDWTALPTPTTATPVSSRCSARR
ncbi:polyketide synthase dehydratase domain-containing protein [Dactylosporangium cerinum]